METFKTGLNAAMAPASKLVQKLLTGCTVDAAGEEQIYQSQNSMFMNFLMIDFMRDACVEVLLNKIEEVAKSDRVIMGKAAIPLPLLPLMLTQLRLLDRLAQGRNLQSHRGHFQQGYGIGQIGHHSQC